MKGGGEGPRTRKVLFERVVIAVLHQAAPAAIIEYVVVAGNKFTVVQVVFTVVGIVSIVFTVVFYDVVAGVVEFLPVSDFVLTEGVPFRLRPETSSQSALPIDAGYLKAFRSLRRDAVAAARAAAACAGVFEQKRRRMRLLEGRSRRRRGRRNSGGAV